MCILPINVESISIVGDSRDFMNLSSETEMLIKRGIELFGAEFI